MNTYFLIFFAMYLVAMVYLAIKAMYKTTTVENFSIGSGDVGPVLTAITFAATFMSASTFMGLPGQMYQVGTPGLWFHAGQWFPCVVTLIIFAKAYRRLSGRMKSLSLPDWLGDRYNSPFLRFFTAVVTLSFIVQIGAQLAGVGAVMKSMMNIPYEWGVIIGLTVVVFYLVLGGTYAHIYTNVVQGGLMILAALAIFFSGFLIFGNIFTEVPDKLAAVDPKFTDMFAPEVPGYAGPLAIIGIFFAHAWWTMNPQLMNKIQYLRSDRDLRLFSILSGLGICLGALTLITGLYTRILVPDGLANIDDTVPTYLHLVFPRFMAALLSVVILAAVMSTTDGIMVYLSTVLGNTLYREGYIRWKRNSGQQVDQEKVDRFAMNICRYGIILVGLAGLPIALNRPASLSNLLWAGNGGILGCLVGPTIMGLYCKRTSKQAAAVGSVGGVVVFMLVFFTGLVQSAFLAVAIAGAASLLLTLAFTYILPPMPQADVDRVFLSEGEAEKVQLAAEG